ncbi:hypothetical protein Gotri_012700 [Gossypium trilobum]|uniref:Uncharacterized protein n=1 Tax=Gossypium trilobum TaxID=34281 RepID=A0A7J9DR89_9ROSI|nr:hypothetical protein [Gossypium trilobum]
MGCKNLIILKICLVQYRLNMWGKAWELTPKKKVPPWSIPGRRMNLKRHSSSNI